jgi:hypothetical protein
MTLPLEKDRERSALCLFDDLSQYSSVGSPGHVFLSYAKEDAESVRRIGGRLRKDGFRIWLDDHDLLPGQHWERAIELAIRGAAAFIVFLSTKSVSKTGFVQKEIRTALSVADRMPEGAVFIVPTRLDACSLPAPLTHWHAIDLCKRGGYSKLVASLRQHAPLAVVPVQARQDLEEDVRFADAAESLLYEELRRSGRLLSQRLGRNRYAFSQGHFLMIRKDFPASFRQLGRTLVDSRPIGKEAIEAILASASPWRSKGTRIVETKVDQQRGMVELKSAKAKAFVNVRYWQLASVTCPTTEVFVTAPLKPVYFERGGKPVAVIMPMRDE